MFFFCLQQDSLYKPFFICCWRGLSIQINKGCLLSFADPQGGWLVSRNAKYNQLLRIEEELGDRAVYAAASLPSSLFGCVNF